MIIAIITNTITTLPAGCFHTPLIRASAITAPNMIGIPLAIAARICERSPGSPPKILLTIAKIKKMITITTIIIISLMFLSMMCPPFFESTISMNFVLTLYSFLHILSILHSFLKGGIIAI